MTKIKVQEMDRKFSQVYRNRRLLSTALGTTGALICSLLGWNIYTYKKQRHVNHPSIENKGEKPNRTQFHKPEYIELPPKVLDSIALTYNNDDLKMNPG